mmetsp:Transcript_26457/g.51839  ORF Transcript_26457/g.51839 Transcript_26457/m.51839 type:complete len:411 (+) Transcript_26457:38-1270(+)
MSCVGEYFAKYRGAGAAGTPIPAWSHTAWSFIGSFIGIAVIGLLQTYYFGPHHFHLMVPAYGAMATLLFSAIKAPVAQPYNTIVGNTLGGIVTVCVTLVLQFFSMDDWVWLGGALTVSLTIVVQELMNAVHPPGAATGLILSIMVPWHKSRVLLAMFPLVPALLGACVLVITALLVNNLAASRNYPLWWSPIKMARTDEKKLLPVDEEGTSSSEEPNCAEAYLHKLSGTDTEPSPRPPLSDTPFSWLGAFICMALIGLLDTYVTGPVAHMKLLIPAFGAMSVIVFSNCKAPLAQPINVVLGNTIGGIVGVLVMELLKYFGLAHMMWLCAALCVSFTIAVQERTNTVHPPGGATALLYALVPDGGLKFIISPALLGAVIFVIVGVIMNNLSPARRYPQRWFFDDAPAQVTE